MRLTDEFSVDCACGKHVEWCAADCQTCCPSCGRLLIVAAFPNEPLMTVGPGGER